MATNKNGVKRANLLNAAKLVVLALCFVLVFALVLSASTFGWFGTTSAPDTGMDVNVADAEATAGATTPTALKNLQTLTLTNFTNGNDVFPKGSEKTWSSTISLSGNAFGDSNVSVYASGNGGATLSGGTGTFQYGQTEWRNASTEAAFNYEIDGILLPLLANPYVTVSVAAKVKAAKGKDYTTVEIFASDNVRNAQYVRKTYINNNENNWKNKQKPGSNGYSYELSINKLNSSDKYIVFAMGQGHAAVDGGGYTSTISDISITFTISVSTTDLTHNADTNIRDGSAPVVVSAWDKNIIDSYTPNRTSISNDWPVYIDGNTALNSILGRVTDRVEFGVGTMRSYVGKLNAPTFNGKTYYKKSTVTFADTFDYSSTGGMMTDLFVTEMVDESGNLKAGALDAFRAHAGIAGRIVGEFKGLSGAKNERFSWDSNTTASYLSAGIKHVTVGEYDEETGVGARFNMWSIENGRSEIQSVYVNGKEVGYAEVTKSNRAEIIVSVYMWANGDVVTRVEDYGKMASSTTIKYSGIDDQDPGKPDILTEANTILPMASGYSNLRWNYVRNAIYEVEENLVEDEDGSTGTPYIWFFSAVKSGSSFSGLAAPSSISSASFKSFAESINYASNLVPIATGNLTNIRFNFVDGTINGVHSIYQPDNAKGAGYYLITLYVFDLAGNSGGTVSYYAKADYEQAEYFIDINSGGTNVTPELNGMWMTNETMLTLDMNYLAGKPTATKKQLSISGNTLYFEDSEDIPHMLIVDGNEIVAFDGADPKTYIHSSGIQCDEHLIVVDIATELDAAALHIEYRDGVFTMKLGYVQNEDGTYRTIAWNANFTLYTGMIYNLDEEANLVHFQSNRWGTGIKLYVDRNAPQTPELSDASDEVAYVNSGNNGLSAIVTGDRNWFTQIGLNLGTVLTFADGIVKNSSFENNVKVYVGVRAVKNAKDIDDSGLEQFESSFANLTQEQKVTYFNRVYNRHLGLLEDDGSDYDLNLISDYNAGMRLIYVWAVDQAGNTSGFNAYFVLADTKEYDVNSALLENEVLGKNTAGIVQKNADGNISTKFKRGDTITFEFNLGDGFVPYLFYKLGNTAAQNVNLATNYSPELKWTANSDFDDIMTVESGNKITFRLDDINKLDELDLLDDNKIKFEFAHRKSVSYNVTSTTVQYNSKEAVVPMTVSDEKAKSAFVFDYFHANGTTRYDNGKGGNVPILPSAAANVGGNYTVKIYIPKDNPNYVTSDYKQDSEGNQTVAAIKFVISNGFAIVRAVATESIFNNGFTLTYTINDMPEEEALRFYSQNNPRGSLKLLGIDKDYSQVGNMIGVGQYDIVQDVAFTMDYYTVTFEGNRHSITPRPITINTVGAKKVYGENDPIFDFTVKANQFTNPDNVWKLVFVEEIFGKPTAIGEGDELVYKFSSGGRITRKMPQNTAEDVGLYDFIWADGAFGVNINFRVVVDSNEKFEIEKRTVTLNVSGQSSSLAYNAVFDKDTFHETIVPTFTLSGIDANFAKDIQGQLVLLAGATAVTGFDTDEYSQVWTYKIGKGTVADTKNIHIVFDNENAEYTVYIAAPGIVIIKAKDDASFSFVFGSNWKEQLVFSKDMFDVSGEDIPDFDALTWTVRLDGVADTTLYPNVGGYRASVSDIVLLKGEEVVVGKAKVASFDVSITPAKISVAPTAQTFERTYGESDAVFGIGFEIKSINGKSVDTDFAGITVDDILKSISGLFARGIYSGDNFKLIGTRYDKATDETGVVRGESDFYSFAVRNAFASTNSNFEIVPEIDTNVRFVVNPKTIVINKSMFRGKSKVYDSSNKAYYEDGEALNISSLLATSDDDAVFVADAIYNTSSVSSRASIIFSNLRLKGDKALSYVLAWERESILVNEDRRVEINYIDNISESNVDSNYIKILAGVIALLKSDFSITKEYDNTNVLRVTDVSLILREEENTHRGTSLLYNKMNMGNVVLEKGSYTGKGVSSNYVMDEIVLFFPMESTTGIARYNGGEYANSGVNVEILTNGVRVTISEIGASITQRVINEKSFKSLSAVDRPYNAGTDVSMAYEFADGALAQDETADDVKLFIAANTSGNQKDAGRYSIVFGNTSEVNNSYRVDANSLNNYYSGNNRLYVNITKAMLLPNVTFDETRIYDGSSVVSSVKYAADGEPMLTTLQYAKALADELKAFSFEKSAVSYVYSINGEANGNVVADSDGNVILHNVMVKGLTVTENGSNNYLKNYDIYGARYGANGYVQVGAAVDGQAIDEYEMLNIAPLNKLNISISENDIILANKIYDGTTDAPITINTPSSIIDDDVIITGQAQFANKNVGRRDVQISGVGLSVKEGGDVGVVNNYSLKVPGINVSMNIYEKPITFQANLGEKTYDGYPDVLRNNIVYTLTGLYGTDEEFYRVQTLGGAFFMDKNVATDNDGNVIVDGKQGLVYNPKLINTKSNTINNYMLSEKFDKQVAGRDYYAYEVDGKFYMGEVPAGVNPTAFYYQLESSTKYILGNDENKVKYDAAVTAGAIVGYFVGSKDIGNGGRCYIVKDSYEGGITSEFDEAISYSSNAYGTINKRPVSIASVRNLREGDVVQKQFDGTDKYFGTKDVDYAFDGTGIYNMITGDNLIIEELNAAYNSAATDAKYVVFTVAKLGGTDKNNYTMGAMPARLNARIIPREINAKLEDGTIVYGSSIYNVDAKIVYTIGKGYELFDDESGSGFYMSFKEFLATVGFIADPKDDIKDADKAYVDKLRVGSYIKNKDGSFSIAPEGTDDSLLYRHLSGSFRSRPQARAYFSNGKPGAGDVAISYILTGGDAQNFVYVPTYTGEGTSTLEVVKKNIYVTTSVKSYSKFYGQASPSIELRYVDENGSSAGAVVSGDNLNSIFGSNYPTVEFRLYSRKNGFAANGIGLDAKINSGLAADECYIAYIALTDGFTSKNYNVKVANVEFDSKKNELQYAFDGIELKDAVTLLNISLEQISGVSAATENVTTVYDGSDQTAKVVTGLRKGDKVFFIGADDTRFVAVDAKTYVNQVVVRRDIVACDGDTNGYFVEWTSPANVTLIIEKASPALTMERLSEYFDGNEKVYGKENVKLGVAGITYDRDKDITLTIEKMGDHGYETAVLRNAGNYRITAKFTSPDPNFKDETISTTYAILRAVISISVGTILEQLYSPDADYTIDYTIADNALGVTKQTTQVKFYKNNVELQKIDKAGRYQFRIVLIGDMAAEQDNFTLSGGAGNLDLTVNSVSSGDGGNTQASVILGNDATMIADSLNVSFVYASNSSSADDIYYASINQYMPLIEREIGTQAKLSAVVKMSVSYGQNNVSLAGKQATVSVTLPADIASNMSETVIYVVNENGVLEKLTDYTLENGVLTYDAENYLGSLAFVKLGKQSPSWITYTVVGCVLGVLLIAAIIITVTVVRKKQLKKIED